MSDLIRDYNNKQQQKYASNLEMPKVVAPKLQEAAPVSDKQMNVTVPQAQPSLEQMTAPLMPAGLVNQPDMTAEFNNQLARQLPTLLHGQPSDGERRSNAFYDWVGGQIEENRKRNAAQAIVAPSLQQFNTPAQKRPNGFGSNVTKLIFGDDDKTNDGILGNEFDITKGRFGQFGGGALGGLMYFLDNTLGLGIVRNTLLDTGANLASQTAGWVAKGGVFDTLFKTGDIGKAIIAGHNRDLQARRNIYGENAPTSFVMQGLQGRDLGALGNLSGDTHDDYRKMYGSSPVAAGLDRAFFGRELTEQESKDYEKLTGYSVKEAAGLKFTPEEEKDYQDTLGRVPEDFKVKMMLRNLTGLVSDIKTDEFLKPLIETHKGVKAASVIPTEVVKDAPRQLPGASSEQRRLPGGVNNPETLERPRTPERPHAERYIADDLLRNVTEAAKGEKLEVRPVTPRRALPRGRDPWVTIDAQVVNESPVAQAMKGLPSSVSPEVKALPQSHANAVEAISQDILKNLEPPKSVVNPIQEDIVKQLRTSTAKSLVVSPPIENVVTPQISDVAAILRQQYQRRVEPGQYILQRLGTVADTDPLIALKSMEPAPRVANPVVLQLPGGTELKLPQLPSTAFAKSAEAKREVELLRPKVEISKEGGSILPETGSELPIDAAKKIAGETLKEVEAAQEPKPKMIPTSKEELLKQARERLNAEKAQRQGIEAPKKEVKQELDVSVVKEQSATETPKQSPVETPKVVEGETPKQRMLREAKERLAQEKAARRDAVGELERAVEEGIAKPVEGSTEVRVDVEQPKGAELLEKAIDFDTMFNKTYSVDDLDEMVSMVSRAAGGAPISFVGKVAPLQEVSRSQKEIYRFASLVPHPENPGKALLPPTKSMVADFENTYGVEHPFKAQAISDSSMKYLTKKGGARLHKSLADIANEQTNPLYRKILSPGSAPIPLAIIEKFEKQLASGGKALVKTSSDTVSAIDTTVKVAEKSPSVVTRTRSELHKIIDDNKLGIKKNLSSSKLEEALRLYEEGGVKQVPEEYFTKAGLQAREASAAPTPKEVEPAKRENKVEATAKKVLKTETLEDLDKAVVKLEDLEPTLDELDKIEKKLQKSVFDHRKKLTQPSHTPEVERVIEKKPELKEKQEQLTELTTKLEEVVVQEQELTKVKQSVDVAVNAVESQRQARVSKLMDKYGMARDDAEDLGGMLENMLSRSGEVESLDPKGWLPSRKKEFKSSPVKELHFDEMRVSPNYEDLRQGVIDSGEYEKAAVYLYKTALDEGKSVTNPVLRILEDGSFEFKSGSSTFFAVMDSGGETIKAQVIEDLRKPDLAKSEITVQASDLKELYNKVVRGKDAKSKVAERLKDFELPESHLTAEALDTEQERLRKFWLATAGSDNASVKRLHERIARFIDPLFGDILDPSKPLTEDLIYALTDNENLLSPNTAGFKRDIKDYQANPLITNLADTIYNGMLEIGRAAWRKASPEQRATILEKASFSPIEALTKESNTIDVVKKLDELPNEVKETPLEKPTSNNAWREDLVERQDKLIKAQEELDYDDPKYDELENQLDEIASEIDKLPDRSRYTSFYKEYRRFKEMGDLPVSPLEAAAINDYMRGGFKELNTALRSDSINGVVAERVKLLDSALEKLPEYKGRVHRGDTRTELYQNLKPGDVFTDKAFLSSNKLDENAKLWEDSPVNLNLESATGRAVKRFGHATYIDKEDEVLFRPGTKFQIVEIKEVDGKLVINAQEVVEADTLSKGETLKTVDTDKGILVKQEPLTRELLSRQNINDAVKGLDEKFTPLEASKAAPPQEAKLKVKTIGEAVTQFKETLREVERSGGMNAAMQDKLNESVRALSLLKDKSYSEEAAQIVARLTGREGKEGKPFMSAAVEMLNDPGRNLSRDEVADVLSYAIGTKDVKFAENMTDAEVLSFGRQIAQRPETFSQFDHLLVGHGTGVVEHGTWSLEARPSTGYSRRDLIQHFVDNNYPKGSEVGVAACETGCPKRVQDAVPPMHRVVSRGLVTSSLDNMQRMIEALSVMPTSPKVMDVLAQYDGLLRESLTANKQRGMEILGDMQKLETEFNDITKRERFANKRQAEQRIKAAQSAIEKELLGDC